MRWIRSLAWTIEYTGQAVKALRKLDKPLARRITSYLRDVAVLSDPRDRGKGLTGPLAGLWRYRVGDYRIICDLNDEHLAIIAVAIDHRSQVYR